MPTGNPFTSAQAPAAMQMLAPDIATQQSQLARQQQMADLLRQQALQPDQGTQVINGWAVRKSPVEALGRMATALMATKGQASIDDKQLALSKALQGRMGDAFNSMAGGDAGGMAAPGPTGTAAPAQPPMEGEQAASGALGTQSPAPAPAAQPAPQMSQVDKIRNQAKAAYMMGNTDLANKLLENISTMTNEQRNMAAMGQDPRLMGQLATAAARKSGIIELQPGTTALDLSNGQERFQPKVGEGISLNNGVASAIPGYAGANASITGAAAGATAAANAGQKMVTVNTATGPVMMTEAQAVEQAGGGQPQPRPTPAPAPGGAPTNLNTMSAQERDKVMAGARAQFGLQPGSAPGTSVQGAPAAPARRQVGIPLQDQGSSAFETSMGNKSVDKLLESRDTARAANDQLISIDESRKAIKTGAYQGFGADFKTDAMKMAQGLGIPIDTDKSSNSDYLRSTLASGILANAKKLGANPTEGDTRLLGTILGGLGKDPKAMDKLLDLQEKMAMRVVDQHNADIASAQSNGGKFPFDLGVKKYQAPAAAAPAPAAATKFDAPPPAAQFTGKRMRAPDGSIMRSNGKEWVKE